MQFQLFIYLLSWESSRSLFVKCVIDLQYVLFQAIIRHLNKLDC